MLSEQELTALDRLRLALGRISLATDDRFSIDAAITLLYVATHPGQNVAEVTRGIVSNKNTVSRQLLNLSLQDRKLKPGLDLLERRHSPVDMREVQYRLSRKGAKLLRVVSADLRDLPVLTEAP